MSSGVAGFRMNFNGQCYMDRSVQRIVHGTSVADVLHEFSKDLLDRLKQKMEDGRVSKPHQADVLLSMEELERTLRAPVYTPARRHTPNGYKNNCHTNQGHTIYCSVYCDRY